MLFSPFFFRFLSSLWCHYVLFPLLLFLLNKSLKRIVLEIGLTVFQLQQLQPAGHVYQKSTSL